MAKDLKTLEDALYWRLINFESYTFGKLTRECVMSKARSVTAGGEFLDAVGEEAFVAWVNKFYDEDIFYASKPASELPVPLKKRPLEVAADDPDRDTKKGRTDPDTIQDRELALGMVHCVVCSKSLKSKDACYTRPNRPDDIVCLLCWQSNEKRRFCETCQAALPEEPPRRPDDFNPGYVLYQRCDPCYYRQTPTTVVHLKRSKEHGVIQDCDVYIGRRINYGGWVLEESPWANPFKLPQKPKPTPEQVQAVLDKYEAYVRAKPKLMARLGELQGKRLGCWCKPKPCHGDVLVKLVEEWRLARQ
jgi:hypothetical protein